MKAKRVKKDKPKVPIWACPECLSKHVQYAKRTNSYTCRRCGHEWERLIK